MSRGATGPPAFKTLLGLTSDRFDRASKGNSFVELHGFGVPSGSLILEYCTCAASDYWLRVLEARVDC